MRYGLQSRKFDQNEVSRVFAPQDSLVIQFYMPYHARKNLYVLGEVKTSEEEKFSFVVSLPQDLACTSEHILRT